MARKPPRKKSSRKSPVKSRKKPAAPKRETPARKFERFISQIEQMLVQSDAKIKSPDRLTDLETGVQREVDATIRYKIGSTPFLITIECRKRGAVQDSTWIEQLACKRQSVGAHVTLAVSASPFSQPAIKKAAARGIQIRTLTESSASDFITWLRFNEVTSEVDTYTLLKMVTKPFDDSPGRKWSPAVLSALQNHGIHAPIYFRPREGNAVSAEALFRWFYKTSNPTLPHGMPMDDKGIQAEITLACEPGAIQVESIDGLVDIKEILFTVSVTRTVTKVPSSALTQYANASATIMQSAQWELPDNVSMTMHRDVVTGATKLHFSPTDENAETPADLVRVELQMSPHLPQAPPNEPPQPAR